MWVSAFGQTGIIGSRPINFNADAPPRHANKSLKVLWILLRIPLIVCNMAPFISAQNRMKDETWVRTGRIGRRTLLIGRWCVFLLLMILILILSIVIALPLGLSLFAPHPDVAIKANHFSTQRLAMQSQVLPPRTNIAPTRLMTYNVNGLKYEQAVLQTIRKSKPSIASMQEVPVASLKGTFDAKMKEMGYNYRAHCQTFRISVLGSLANVIYSTLPITSNQAHYVNDPYGNRCIVEAKIADGGHKLVVFGTHLTNGGSNAPYRVSQINTLNALSKERKSQGWNMQAVLGDLNEVRQGVAQPTAGIFVDSIDAANSPHPPSTQWRGRRIDYVLLSNELAARQVKNAQVVHSDGSDHIPIMADVSFQDAGLAAQFQPSMRGMIPAVADVVTKPPVVLNPPTSGILASQNSRAVAGASLANTRAIQEQMNQRGLVAESTQSSDRQTPFITALGALAGAGLMASAMISHKSR